MISPQDSARSTPPGRVSPWSPPLPAGMEAPVHLSRLAWRWLLHTDLRAEQVKAAQAGRVAPVGLGPDGLDRIMARQERALAVGGDLMPTPRQRWPDVPRAVARAIAIEAMQAEPEEAERFASMTRADKAAVADAKTRGQRAHQAEDFRAQREQCVFLSRFFPVPAPGCWTLEAWTRAQTMQIGRKLAEALAQREQPAEPAWFPDGWRESMVFFGQEVS